MNTLCRSLIALALIAAPAPLAAQTAHQHDMARMPGLKGENASPEESAEIATLFRNFRTLSREVEMLPNGIRATTRSSDPEVMDVLISHTIGMIDRVERGDDPKIRIQSPTLGIFFENPEAIDTTVEVGIIGIVVTQTSEDPQIVAALQAHAEEVSDMVEMGMHAVHMRMMRDGQTH